MAIHLEERFTIRAPVGAVWDFLVDPHRVVACIPGGELGQVVDDRNFTGRVKVRVGPLTLAYGGRVRLADVDAAARRVTIVGQARETAGSDSARLTLESWLAPAPGGATEVVANARIDVAGRVVELGRGVLEQLGHVVFQDFSSSVRARLEAEERRRLVLGGGEAGAEPPALPPPAPPLRALPVVLRALRAWVSLKLRRGGGTAPGGRPSDALHPEPGPHRS